MVPKFFFIGRKALASTPERVKEALRITPVEGVFAITDIDAKLAADVSETVMGLHRPLAIVADFPFDLGYLDEQGRLVPSELPTVEKI